MRTSLIPLSLTVALLACGARSTPAQAQPAKQPAAAPAAKARPGIEAKRARLRQRIRALRAWRLTEALELDEATAARLFPILSRYDDRMVKAARQGRALRRQLRQAVKKGAPDAQMSALVDRVVAQQTAMWKLQAERFQAVRKVLSPRQAATILVVLPQIDRAIERQIRAAMKRHGKRGRGGRRAPGAVKNPFGGPGNGKHRRPRPRPDRGGDMLNPF